MVLSGEKMVVSARRRQLTVMKVEEKAAGIDPTVVMTEQPKESVANIFNTIFIFQMRVHTLLNVAK